MGAGVTPATLVTPEKSMEPPLSPYRCWFRHSHGGTGAGSLQSPRFVARASASSSASSVSLGTYWRYHHARPARTKWVDIIEFVSIKSSAAKGEDGPGIMEGTAEVPPPIVDVHHP